MLLDRFSGVLKDTVTAHVMTVSVWTPQFALLQQTEQRLWTVLICNILLQI